MDDTATNPKTGRMFQTNWFDPGWHKGNMENGSNGREEVAGETAGKGEAWASIFNFGTEECPGRVFISKFEAGGALFLSWLFYSTLRIFRKNPSPSEASPNEPTSQPPTGHLNASKT